MPILNQATVILTSKAIRLPSFCFFLKVNTIGMLDYEYFINKIYVKFDIIIYRIPMDSNGAPLLADLCLFSYEFNCMQKLV